MSAEDALLTVAEMAIAVAGFSAIVAAFSGSGRLVATDRRRFVWLFANAVVAGFLAFVPVLLQEATFSGVKLWQYSSAAMCLAWAIAAALWVSDEVRAKRPRPSEPAGFWQGPLALVPSFLNFVLQAVNALGLLWEPSSAAYLAGTLVWLYGAVLPFLSIVLERPAA